jgi:hypothetical protein
MKYLKFYALLGIVFISGELFSQSIRPKDLIGKWTSTTDSTISQKLQIWHFKNESLLIKTDSMKYFSPNIFSYKIYLSHDTTILKTHLNFKSGGNVDIFYSMNKISEDQFNLIIIKIEETRYNGVRETKKGHPSIIWVLKKIK